MPPGMTPDPGDNPEPTIGTDGTEGTDSRPSTTPPRRSRNPRRDKLAKVENRLNEMFATIAVAQTGLGVMSGDQRHVAGGHVTSEMSPMLVEAWVKLARENDRIANVLLRMSETTAWGEVILATGGFIYSQAQAYGAVPPTMPNPWVAIPVPPSPDVAAAYAEPPSPGWTPPNGSEPITGRTPPRSGVDEASAAREEAERQRKAAEAQRLKFNQRQGN